MRNWIIVLLIFIVPEILVAQQQPEHILKPYQASDGKLYWPAELPVYIKLSASPEDEAESHLMKSERSAEYVDPYFFDTEGINFIRTKWAINKKTKESVWPLEEVLWEVYRDGTAPETELKLNNSNYLTKGDQLIGKDELKIHLLAKDELSGLDRVYFSINGEPFEEYQSEIILSTEAEYLLKYYSVDQVGNAEPVKSQKIILDLSAPATSFYYEGPAHDDIISSKTRIGLKSEDAIFSSSKIFYVLDENDTIHYKGLIEAGSMAEGEHNIVFFSQDNLGNLEKSQSRTFFVDKTAPFITSDVLGDLYISNGKEYSSGRTRIKLVALDNKAGIEGIYYSVNDGDYQRYENPFFLSGQSGSQSIRFYAVDQVGNKSMSSTGSEKGSAPYLDLAGPSLGSEFKGPTFITRDTVFVNSNTKINLFGSDPESGLHKIMYQVDGSLETEYDNPFQLSGSGLHIIDFIGFDNVSNTNRSRLSVILDELGPEIESTPSISAIGQQEINGKNLPVYSSHVMFYLSALDKTVGVEDIAYSINGNPDIIYHQPIKNFKPGEVYRIVVKATDKLGNENSSELNISIESGTKTKQVAK